MVYSAFSMSGVHFGTGHHHKDLEVASIQAAMKVRLPSFFHPISRKERGKPATCC